MKKIIRIARVELSNLFYSPIAWLLLCIFIVQCGMTFADAMTVFLQKQRMSSLFSFGSESASVMIFTDQYAGVYTLLVDKLYFYIPLLTMGLISREVSSGSIRLLHSSPVTVTQIVLGKFLSMVAYSLVLVAVLAVFAAVGYWKIPHAETGVLLSGLFAFFLLLCTYSAIGLFMSSLTSYQVVAALATLAVFAFLNYVGMIWQDIDFVRDITYFLSINNRTKVMFDGLITSREILYFLIITLLFLGFCMMRLKAEQHFRPTWARALRYCSLVVVALGLGYITSRPGAIAYWDVTQNMVNTLEPSTQALLKATGDEPLELTAYVNLLDSRYAMHGKQSRRNTYLRTWEKYTRFKPSLKYNFYYYYDTSGRTASMMERSYRGKTLKEVGQDWSKLHKTSLSYFQTPQESRKIPVLKGEEGRMILELSYNGKKAPLRMYDDRDVWPSEAHFNAALRRLMTPDSIQRVAFLTGQFQRDSYLGGDRNYAIFSSLKSSRQALVNNGFDILTVNEGEDIPNNLAALIVADPKSAFSTDRLEKLSSYIDAGGNLLITTEPNKREIILPLLQQLGVDMQTGTLVSQNRSEVPSVVPTLSSRAAGNMSQGNASLYNGRKSIVVEGAAALEYGKENASGFLIEPLLSTASEHQWLKKGVLVNDSAMVEFQEQDGDVAGRFDAAVALARTINGRDQRIVVAGDGDFINNIMLQKYNNENGLFVQGMFKWFSNGVFPVEISAKPLRDPTLDITDEGLDKLKIVLLWMFPSLLAITSIVLLLRRKRK